MLNSYPWLSIIPPLVTVIVAIKFRQILVAIFLGLWTGAAVIANGNIFKGLIAAVERCIAVFKDPGSTKVILFCCFIGAIIAYAQRSGGVQGFIEFLSRRNLVRSRKQAQLLTIGIGVMIPVESSINILVPGTVSRPLYDEYKISREKLAYLCMSFSAPICSLVPANAWGAYVSGVVGSMGISNPYRIYLRSIPWNLYALFTIGLAMVLILSGKDFFAMAKAERKAKMGEKISGGAENSLISDEAIMLKPKEGVVPRPSNMLVPILMMIATMIAGMFLTGHGKFTSGSGSTSVFFAVLFAIVAAGIKYIYSKIMSFNELMNLFFKSVGSLAGMGFLITMSFALSTICLDLKTGPFVAGLARNIIDIRFIPAILFVLTSVISFATGTAWGAWAIMIPIGLGFFTDMNTPAMITMGAMMSGGVFGNHCSPIADTTIMSTLVAGNDLINNVKAILPYALLTAALTAGLFLLIGFILI